MKVQNFGPPAIAPYSTVLLETINLLGARALLIICADFVRQKNRCARSLMMSPAALTKFQGHFRVHPVYHKFSFWATGLVYQKVGIVTMI